MTFNDHKDVLNGTLVGLLGNTEGIDLYVYEIITHNYIVIF